MARGLRRSRPRPAAAPSPALCSDCGGAGVKPELVCCGRVLGTGECCSQPEPGWETCQSCQPPPQPVAADEPF